MNIFWLTDYAEKCMQKIKNTVRYHQGLKAHLWNTRPRYNQSGFESGTGIFQTGISNVSENLNTG
jgi:hypothetical protein